MTETLEERAQLWPRAVGIVSLWVVTSVLSVVLIPTTIDLVTRIYAAFWADYTAYGPSYWRGVALRQFLVLPLAVLSVIVIIGGAETYMRHAGTHRSWLFATRTLAVEVGLLIMSWLL